jgi:hypothetical protein
MAHFITTLEGIYNTYFQPPYKVNDNRTAAVVEEYEKIKHNRSESVTIHGIDTLELIGGREVFLPVKFLASQRHIITIRCCTIRVSNKKTVIRTAVSEHKGTVKEQFNIGDYVFTIKGVLIGEEKISESETIRKFPSDKIDALKFLYETTERIDLENALAELFLFESTRVAITDIEFPDVQGGSKFHRPFVMTCESDFVDNLTVQ